MTRAAVLLLVAAARLAAVYQPYESNTFTYAPPNWQMAGSLQFTPGGLTASGTSGTMVYTASSGGAEEVRMDISFTEGGGTYTAYLLAGTTDLTTANLYALEVGIPVIDSGGCWAPTRFWKRVNGVESTLGSYYQYCRYNGQNRVTLRAYARPGMQLVWVSPTLAYPYFDNDPNIQGGRSAIGLSNTPGRLQRHPRPAFPR